MVRYIPPPDPKGEIEVQQCGPNRIEVWFIPEDLRLQAANIDLQDRAQHRVKMLEMSAKDRTISIFPIDTRPNLPDFLGPKYDRVREIVVAETDFWRVGIDNDLPQSREEVIEVLTDLPKGFTKDPDYGLGLAQDYRFIVEAIEDVSECSRIVLGKGVETGPDESERTFYISTADFEAMRRQINAITNASQNAGRSVKEATTYNHIATKIGKPLVEVTTGTSPVRRMITAKAMGEEVLPETEQDAVIHALTASAKSLGVEQAERLAKLQSDIELVTLDALIARFSKMLGKPLKEDRWQKFFQQNPFILHMAFGYPVIKVRDQASVGGRKASGKGEKIADFLVKNALTNNTAIFEIKTPQAALLMNKAYREGVFAPTKELSGSINQALDQRYQFQKQITSIKDNSRIWDIETYAVHCCLIIGRMPQDADERKSFELFRHNSKDVSVVTFDELFEKLKHLAAFLRSSNEEDAS